jgi:hypothetical protein
MEGIKNLVRRSANEVALPESVENTRMQFGGPGNPLQV